MQNKILDRPAADSAASATRAGTRTPPSDGAPPSVAGQAIDRSLARRRAAAEAEVERLIAAAFRVIERTGHLEPKVSEILAEAGLSNQAFYRHFRGKRELLVAVLDEGIRGLASYLDERMAEQPDALSAVRAWVRGMAVQAIDPGGASASRPFALARGLLAESFPEEVAGSEQQISRPLRDVLERARREGTMPAIDPAIEAEALYHLMMGWVEARLVEGRIPASSEVDRLEAFALAALTRGEAEATTPLDASEEREE